MVKQKGHEIKSNNVAKPNKRGSLENHIAACLDTWSDQSNMRYRTVQLRLQPPLVRFQSPFLLAESSGILGLLVKLRKAFNLVLERVVAALILP